VSGLPLEELDMPGFDLHTHSTESDGTTTIEENVAAAVALGLAGIAITDHDTMSGVGRAVAAAEGTGLEVIPGTEFSAELDGVSVHVLGYWTDPDDPALAAEMDRLRNERERRAQEIVARFEGLGIPVSFARVAEIAGNAPIGRPHIAAAVVELGAASDTREVFDRYLADGGPAYVPKYAVDPVTAVELLVGAGGGRHGRHRGGPSRPHRWAAPARPRPGGGARPRRDRRLGLPR
jgi:predicted metal-dependent phosphoesterase TrpH